MRLTAVFILIISSFILTGTMGPIFLDFMEHDDNNFCPISALFEKNCLSMSNALNSVVHHISVWQKIFQAIISEIKLLFFVFLAFLSLLIFARFKKLTQLITGKFNEFRRNFLLFDSLFNSYQPFLSWLTLKNRREYHLFANRRMTQPKYFR